MSAMGVPSQTGHAFRLRAQTYREAGDEREVLDALDTHACHGELEDHRKVELLRSRLDRRLGDRGVVAGGRHLSTKTNACASQVRSCSVARRVCVGVWKTRGSLRQA